MDTQQRRLAWITGGGTGIGRALAQSLAADGWQVVVSGRRQGPLEETAALAVSNIHPWPLDVSDLATGTILNTANNGNAIVHTIIGNAPVDSLQEFRGTTAGDLASNGNGGGGQFDMVTKSGTNHFHGNINEYHRDTDLEANEWFNNFDGVPRSPLIRNQFGGNIGGPLWKDKIFFFFDYNGRRDTLAGQAERTVPTDSFLKNDTITYYNNIAAGTTDSINAAQVAGYDPQGIGFSANMMKTIGGRRLFRRSDVDKFAAERKERKAQGRKVGPKK